MATRTRALVAPTVSTPAVAPEWQPPNGCLVSDARNFTLWLDGVRYEHVSEAPDGRWVYQRS